MHEIVVISGKGGTGKTSLTGAFAHLASNHIICDLDVDAPDLHLLLKPENETIEDFYSGNEARIDQEKCLECGLCQEMCRYQAVIPSGQGLYIDPLKCEGCKVCVHFCPEQAIDFPEKYCGRWYVSRTRFGPMVHAALFPGEENSGRLVTLLRQKAREMAREKGLDLILCDGAPGIGCPVISSLAGTDLAVVVTEPTLSGLHDLERVVDLCAHFRIPVGIIINKYDLNSDMSRNIEAYSARHGFQVIAKLPYDELAIEAVVQGRVMTEYPDADISKLLNRAWTDIIGLVKLKDAA
ncbi:MAG: ATP-binding protein [Deltaproteobacteria bacterium]|nr:ATP-binding protein [Deltaproteobacteria bacterium]